MRLFPIIILQVVVAMLACGAGSDEGEVQRFAEFIKLLGSPRYENRQRATRELMKCEEAEPTLRKALGSVDLETNRRIRKILIEFDRRRLIRQLPLLQRVEKTGEVDLLVEAFARRLTGINEKAGWHTILGQTEVFRVFEKRTYRKIFSSSECQAATRLDALQRLFLSRHIVKPLVATNDLIRTGGFYLIRTEKLVLDCPLKNPAICSGPVQITDFQNAELITCNSVSAAGLNDAVVICDGDFTADFAVQSLVIARGKVWIGIAKSSTILSDREIEVAYELTKSAAISAGKVKLAKECRILDNSIKENQPDALGPVKFFGLAAAGLKVKTAADGLHIQRVTSNKPFARAGLRADDVIRAVDGAKVVGYESFRRLIRRKLVLEEEATFRIRRGDATLDIAVRFAK